MRLRNRNKFDLSHDLICDMEAGKLVPVLCQEVVPGDDFKITPYAFVRMAPMITAPFTRISLWFHAFYVPNRIIYDDWDNLITNGGPKANLTAVHPVVKADITKAAWQVGGLADYLGIPVKDRAGVNSSGVPDGSSVVNVNGMEFNALPFRAYNRIVNDWYTPEFVKDEIAIQTTGGLDTETVLDLQNRSWKRDYLTSALPFTQLGEAASLPLSGNASVFAQYNGKLPSFKYLNGSNPPGTHALTSNGSSVFFSGIQNSSVYYDPADTLKVDLSKVTAASVLDLRMAELLQAIAERRARHGNRTVEWVASEFGVRIPDSRLQRAEFLGGGRADIMISEVLQTSQTSDSSPQANIAGKGTGAAKVPTIRKAFTEHGWVIVMASILPRQSYYQGVPRHFLHRVWTDYLTPSLQAVGEQPIYNEEVLAAPTNNPGGVFAFQPRYEPYRRALSRVAGHMRTSLDYFHTARQFSSPSVSFNWDFLKANPTKRIFSAGDQADAPFWCQFGFDISAIRPLSKRGVPGVIFR
ncbi:major capsid protein [Sigmofec virus UA08Rod_6800]|uniref:Major capsid protein n=1 Tax=Sigmofec virus UA08Rod_6800 TaxID=2929240 RepID=A0A976N0H7_9VIRU|nr:major capsid protein [Sigmofec virus UA08Rod_6800]